LALLYAPLVSGCGSDDAAPAAGGTGGSCTVDTSYNPPFDPSKFVATIDNPLLPMIPGTKLTYSAGDETVELEVLSEKKTILGVSCTIVHDVAKVSGEIIEDTFDWFAQDQSGAVWYMGEDTKELSGGQVTSTHGSWQAGVDGAKPGYILPPNPMVGMKFRQEYYACEAEDFGEVLDLNASATVPVGSYTGCLKTRDTTPLEPAAEEEKYYCPGVGVALIVDVKSQDREELTQIVKP
jgi:hypothetical protein